MSTEIDLVLKTLKLSENELQALDYLLIPYHKFANPDGLGHGSLLGIAPKQKLVFIIDSMRFGVWASVDEWPFQGLMALALKTLPRSLNWPLFGQWSNRGAATDGSPNSAQQRDYYNCAVFSLTTAMCLAFGYDLPCYTEDDMNFKKRKQMLAELSNDGFNDPFNYGLFHIPQVAIDLPSKYSPLITVADVKKLKKHGLGVDPEKEIEPDTEILEGDVASSGPEDEAELMGEDVECLEGIADEEAGSSSAPLTHREKNLKAGFPAQFDYR
ncbi:hypothetical protein G7Y89_g13707 [Cudoniella acicularis]|uniref:Ubiquitin-like protease family profile domain-containing protein n=1 Tax=Cudoniella acicularis TaxID=354080 RepID=A0A8H4VW62_9HELO|nr:hypothetical protein G7Y89_g13707 [Cudoniella acicularis]